MTKYGTKRGAVALGRALPFGIGAAIGGGANYAFARAIAGHADRFFRDLPPALQARPGPGCAPAPPSARAPKESALTKPYW